tara:strand:- start:3144 stop:3512 length:369 start_codon:yes stop_codon:yes gene_type:complete
MTNSKLSSPAAYSDVRTVLDLALEKPGLIYKLKSYGQAINFRQRCNRYRKILREQEVEISGHVPGFRPETAYDTLNIRQTDEHGKWDNHGLFIRFELQELGGDLIDPVSGEIITIPTTPVIE